MTTATRRAALLAGLLYLTTHVTSVAALLAYGPTLADPGLAAGRSALFGVALETLLALGVVGTGVALLPVLAPHAPIGAPAFAALRTLEGAVIAVGAASMLALATVVDGSAAGAPLADPALARGLVAVHQGTFLVGQGLVISVTTLVIAATVYRTRLVPLWIGLLGLIGGALVLVSNVAQMFGVLDRGGSLAALLAVPVFAFEISFAVQLIVRGVRPGRVASTPPLPVAAGVAG